MGTRVPASMRTRQQLSDLIEGRLSSADGRAELIKLATRLIVEGALEVEAGDAVGRGYYEHGGETSKGSESFEFFSGVNIGVKVGHYVGAKASQLRLI